MDDFETLREYISIHSYERAGAITALDRIENFHVNLLARVRELEAENERLLSDYDTNAVTVLRARVRELEADGSALELEIERLREALREIDDCADDWNRVEDLARQALATPEPSRPPQT